MLPAVLLDFDLLLQPGNPFALLESQAAKHDQGDDEEGEDEGEHGGEDRRACASAQRPRCYARRMIVVLLILVFGAWWFFIGRKPG